jgi:hypothetical protein
MSEDHIRYDLLAQAALRGVVRTVLSDAAKNGLPGDHHFKITFATEMSGVKLSERMRAQYPQAMTIILQHQFWDLAVRDETFEVGLSFGGVGEKLVVPFNAVTAFLDPSVPFGFQFEPIDAEQADEAESGAKAPKRLSTPSKSRPRAAPKWSAWTGFEKNDDRRQTTGHRRRRTNHSLRRPSALVCRPRRNRLLRPDRCAGRPLLGCANRALAQ